MQNAFKLIPNQMYFQEVVVAWKTAMSFRVKTW